MEYGILNRISMKEIQLLYMRTYIHGYVCGSQLTLEGQSSLGITVCNRCIAEYQFGWTHLTCTLPSPLEYHWSIHLHRKPLPLTTHLCLTIHIQPLQLTPKRSSSTNYFVLIDRPKVLPFTHLTLHTSTLPSNLTHLTSPSSPHTPHLSLLTPHTSCHTPHSSLLIHTPHTPHSPFGILLQSTFS